MAQQPQQGQYGPEDFAKTPIKSSSNTQGQYGPEDFIQKNQNTVVSPTENTFQNFVDKATEIKPFQWDKNTGYLNNIGNFEKNLMSNFGGGVLSPLSMVAHPEATSQSFVPQNRGEKIASLLGPETVPAIHMAEGFYQNFKKSPTGTIMNALPGLLMAPETDEYQPAKMIGEPLANKAVDIPASVIKSTAKNINPITTTTGAVLGGLGSHGLNPELSPLGALFGGYEGWRIGRHLENMPIVQRLKTLGELTPMQEVVGTPEIQKAASSYNLKTPLLRYDMEGKPVSSVFNRDMVNRFNAHADDIADELSDINKEREKITNDVNKTPRQRNIALRKLDNRYNNAINDWNRIHDIKQGVASSFRGLPLTDTLTNQFINYERTNPKKSIPSQNKQNSK